MSMATCVHLHRPDRVDRRPVARLRLKRQTDGPALLVSFGQSEDLVFVSFLCRPVFVWDPLSRYTRDRSTGTNPRTEISGQVTPAVGHTVVMYVIAIAGIYLVSSEADLSGRMYSITHNSSVRKTIWFHPVLRTVSMMGLLSNAKSKPLELLSWITNRPCVARVRLILVIGCFCLWFLLLIQTVTKLSQMLLKPLHALVGDMNAMTSFELRHEQNLLSDLCRQPRSTRGNWWR